MTKVFALLFLLASIQVYGMDSDTNRVDKRNGVYFTKGGNGGILSMSSVKKDGASVKSIPRFTFFFNVGSNANLDLSRRFGVFLGANLSNIGMITKTDSVKLKQRVYTIGVPVGIKIGNVKEGMVYTGFEANFPINYKEKRFVNGDKEGKFNEWFSNRTNQFIPAVFLGYEGPKGFNLKVQYFISDFINASFSKNNVQPYAGIQSKIFFISFGYRFKSDKNFRHKG